jgi:acetyl esterase/lipase
VLPAPEPARVIRDLVYLTDAEGALHMDAYLPRASGRYPGVLLVNGDAAEDVIATAKDWGVYRSYGAHLSARGLVGLPFNHRSTRAGARRSEVDVQVSAAIDFARAHAADLDLDPDRIGIWVFSAAGAFALARCLRERPPYLRAVAGFYTVWDTSPFAEREGSSAEDVARWSATAALGDSAAGLPPILVGRAGRDAPPLKTGADRFIARALELDADLTVWNHPSGQHGFDIRNDDARAREIIQAALDFFARRLSG